MKLARSATLGLLACALVSTASAQSTEAKQFSIPGHGSLVFNLPKGWRVAERPLENPASTALRIAPPSGNAFLLQITSVRLDRAKLAAYTPQELEARVRKSAGDMLAQAVEQQATLVELRGSEAYGYHFSLTDRKTTFSADDYKYVTQGTLLSGELVTVFTFLHREAAAREKQQALRMLADARHSREAAAPQADALQVKDLEQSYELSVPVSRLVMRIPKSGMPRATRQASANSHPRYFYFVDGLLNVSGWFEPAGRFNGVEPFWERETENWRKQGLPPPVQASFARIGNWDAILYDIATPVGTNSHIRAHWVQAGTWIDVHLSLTSDQPSAELRGHLTELLQTILVTEKN